MVVCTVDDSNTNHSLRNKLVTQKHDSCIFLNITNKAMELIISSIGISKSKYISNEKSNGGINKNSMILFGCNDPTIVPSTNPTVTPTTIEPTYAPTYQPSNPTMELVLLWS